MSTKNSIEFFSPARLIHHYPTLTQSTTRDALAEFVTSHVYLGLEQQQKKQGTTPFPATVWQSWANLQLETPAVNAPVKVRQQKTKPVPQFDKDMKPILNKDMKQKTKKEKIEGFEMVDKRLRKVATFNAQGKAALAFVVTLFVHESVMAIATIKDSNIDSIKDAICSIDGCEYRISPAIFALCDSVPDARIKEMLPKIAGGLRGKLESAVDKIKDVTDSAVRNLLIDTIIKLLRIFTMDLAGDLWNDTKEVKEKKVQESEEEEDEDADEPGEIVGKGNSVSDKRIRSELLKTSNRHLDNDDKLAGEFFTGMDEFYDSLLDADKIKKTENKKKRDDNAVAKKKADADKKSDAKDATDEQDEPEEKKEKEKPKTKKPKKEEDEPEEKEPKKDGGKKAADEEPKKKKDDDDEPADAETTPAPRRRRANIAK